VAVLASVCVGVTDHVGLGVGDGQMAVHPLLVLNSVIDRIIVGTEDYTPVAVLSDVFISVLQVLTDEKPNSSVGPTDECQYWWFVSLEVSAPLFESPRSRGLDSSSSWPFSPAVT
jgi:hypothetical protein